MARIKHTGGDLTGKIGALSYYKRKDLEGIIVRTKGGPSKKMVKTSTSFALTRRYNMEFGGCSKMGAQIRRKLRPINVLADYNTTTTLNSLASIMLKSETTGVLGQRSIRLSKNRDMLKGFSFNQTNTLDSYFRGIYTCDIYRQSLTAKITISPIISSIHLKNCSQFPLFRWILQVGIVEDIIFNVNLDTYNSPTESNSPLNFTQATPWLRVNDNHDEINIEVSNLLNRELLSTESIIMALGLEFGKSLSDTVVVAVKRHGAGKIVMVV